MCFVPKMRSATVWLPCSGGDGGMETDHFADRQSLNFPLKYVLLAVRFFDVSLSPPSVVKRWPQLPPPIKSTMHPELGLYFVEGALTTQEILKDGKLTWCLPPDLWEKSSALFQMRFATAWLPCPGSDRRMDFLFGRASVEPDAGNSHYDNVFLRRMFD